MQFEAMEILEYVAFTIGIFAIAIVVWGVVLGMYDLCKHEFFRFKGRSEPIIPLHQIRNKVGSYLLLGLEFLIAADVVRTIVEPTIDELIILGGIVVIRTIVSFFLGREIGDAPKYPFPGKAKKSSDAS
jgi:uncharacterized membrane protein